MRSTRSTTERLLAARPLVADHLDELVGPYDRARLLDQILTSDPTELVPVSEPRRRRPRGRIVAALVGAVAVALVAAGLAGRTRTGRPVGGNEPTSTESAATAVLLAQVNAAVDDVHEVAVIDSTANGVRSTIWTLTDGGNNYRDRYVLGGKPSYELSRSTANGQTTLTVVDFPARAWWTEASVPIPGNACAEELVPNSRTPVSARAVYGGRGSTCEVFGPTPAQIVQNLNAREFKITGRPFLDGHPAIEITAYYPAAKNTFRLFVDASSYLPVLINNISPDAKVSTTYSYLPTTAANMGLLQVPIPAGFRHAAQPITCNPSQLKAHETVFSCP